MTPRSLAGLLALALSAGATSLHAAAPPTTIVATPASPQTIAELHRAVDEARVRFEARDLAGVLGAVSEQYRSSGITKAAVRGQLSGMFAVYQALQARVRVDRIVMVGEAAWIYTSGELSGLLPLVGWVTFLTWQEEPEVARREAAGWRLFGFQD